ncbi:MAG: hypothetical protein K6F15_05415 [Treponema sp.]|nr:hypothetical protein [Treponema sp.]
MKKVLSFIAMAVIALSCLSAKGNYTKLEEIQYRSDFDSFRLIESKCLTAEEFVTKTASWNVIFEEYVENNKFEYSEYLKMIRNGTFPMEYLSLWGVGSRNVSKNPDFTMMECYDVPKEDSSLDPNNTGDCGGWFDLLIASDKYIYSFTICPVFTFYDFAKDYPKYFAFREYGLNGPNYYWKDYRAFLSDMYSNSPELPPAVLKFNMQLTEFMDTIKFKK